MVEARKVVAVLGNTVSPLEVVARDTHHALVVQIAIEQLLAVWEEAEGWKAVVLKHDTLRLVLKEPAQR
jgi:hypothetical protein